MASNETSRPMTGTRNEHGISPVEDSAGAGHESVARRSVNRDAPSSPTIPADPATIQPPPSTRQQPYPQSQAPYPSYQYPPQAYYTQPVRLLPRYSKSWTFSKLILALSLIIVAIVIVALACVFVTEAGDASWVAAYALPITIASILWNGAELITFAVRSRKNEKRGIHPGAHVGLHLCFWIACVFAVLLSVTEAIAVNADVRDCADETTTTSTYSYYSSYCDQYDGIDMTGRYLPMLRAVAALFCLMLLVHFILFVFACVDTHKRNLLKPAGMVVPPVAPQAGMYYPPPQPGVAPYYPYPAPMAPQQGPFAGQPNVPGAVAVGQRTDPAAQNYQNFAGFYAPVPPQPTYAPAQAAQVPTGSNNEKVVPSTSA
ncbi:uncharacterized protein F4807DRAFT_148241 [Annulohypoxylon truncatum]|uniref:uncharacterized protein n=1 Tax=Annulohypoxylon truncatum TaxID=327061 RepID=UPI0020085524|nr:uncharacterized protein F4807DRAFT_148241 [Annulohypoxylon truncatum]KAI1208333.1 hypothetical protein F4807DRAFT_148241 [Annulohypoxylon truncatum]